MKRPAWIPVLLTLATLSCGEGQPATEGEAESAGPAAIIVSPTDGATVTGPSVRIELDAQGVTIVPAGTEQPNSGHHHLFVNHDLTPPGQPMPVEEGVIHLGAAQTEHVLENLEPGDYTVIAVLGNHIHVPLDASTDTVRFTVVAPS